MQDVDGRNKPGHDENLNCGNFNDEVGQPFGGVNSADGFGPLCHLRQLRWIVRERRDRRGQPSGREVGLHDSNRAARGLQNAGILELVLVQRMRQRHQYGRPPDG